MPNENDVQRCQECGTPVAVAGVLHDLRARLVEVTAKLEDVSSKLAIATTPPSVHLGPFETPGAAIAGGSPGPAPDDGVPAEVFEGHGAPHTTDVDVVGEAGTVVEVKHDQPPPRMTGPTFDLP